MFEKLSQSAEQVVGQVRLSRRGFLGRAAQVAAGLGAALAALGAAPTEAQAQGQGKWQYPNCWCPPGTIPVCYYRDYQGRIQIAGPSTDCRCPKPGGWLSGKFYGRGCQ